MTDVSTISLSNSCVLVLWQCHHHPTILNYSSPSLRDALRNMDVSGPTRAQSDDRVDIDWLIDSLDHTQPNSANDRPSAQTDVAQGDVAQAMKVEVRPVDRPDMPDGTERCWGAEACGGTTVCIQGFRPGKAHFKNKFCSNCVNGIDLPLHRVRAITPSLMSFISNTNSRLVHSSPSCGTYSWIPPRQAVPVTLTRIPVHHRRTVLGLKRIRSH